MVEYSSVAADVVAHKRRALRTNAVRKGRTPAAGSPLSPACTTRRRWPPVRAPGCVVGAGAGGCTSVDEATDALGRYLAAGADRVNVASGRRGTTAPSIGRRGGGRAALGPHGTAPGPQRDKSVRMSDQRIDELSGAAVVVAAAVSSVPTGRRWFARSASEAWRRLSPATSRPSSIAGRRFDGRSEVVLYTPEHDASFPDLVAGARRVVDLWTDRTVALAVCDDVAYVLVFENWASRWALPSPIPTGRSTPSGRCRRPDGNCGGPRGDCRAPLPIRR